MVVIAAYQFLGYWVMKVRPDGSMADFWGRSLTPVPNWLGYFMAWFGMSGMYHTLGWEIFNILATFIFLPLGAFFAGKGLIAASGKSADSPL